MTQKNPHKKTNKSENNSQAWQTHVSDSVFTCCFVSLFERNSLASLSQFVDSLLFDSFTRPSSFVCSFLFANFSFFCVCLNIHEVRRECSLVFADHITHVQVVAGLNSSKF
jgi:hypothetical protein